MLALSHIERLDVGPATIAEPVQAVVDLMTLKQEQFLTDGIFRAITADGHDLSCRVSGLNRLLTAQLARAQMTVTALDESLDTAWRSEKMNVRLSPACSHASREHPPHVRAPA